MKGWGGNKVPREELQAEGKARVDGRRDREVWMDQKTGQETTLPGHCTAAPSSGNVAVHPGQTASLSSYI